MNPKYFPLPFVHPVRFAFVIAAAIAPAAALRAQMQLGHNLDAVNYHSTAPAFVDCMKMADDWRTRQEGNNNDNTGYAASIPRRADGYPTHVPFQTAIGPQFVQTYAPIYEDGVHKIRITGTGTVWIDAPNFSARTFHVSGSLTVDANISGAHRFTDPHWNGPVPAVRQEPSLFKIQILSSSSADPIRGISIMRPGHHNSSPHTFDPGLLAGLANASVIRFMDWQRTNNSPRTAFYLPQNSRDYFTQGTEYGVSLEYAFDLAAAAAADLWLCVPHAMSDQGIHDMAQFCASRLPEGRKLYIEYTNEHWNDMFDAYYHLPNQPWPGQNLDQKYGSRAKYVFDAFTQKFGAAGKGARLVRVLSNQAANSWRMEEALVTAGNTPDALAIAPYFGTTYTSHPSPIPSFASLASDAHTKFPEVRSWLESYRNLALRRGKPVICYEGGQHFVGARGVENNNELTQQLVSFNREPAMGQLYTTYLNMLRDHGIALFCNFSLAGHYSKWGSWGAMEYWGQPFGPERDQSVKLHAIRTFFSGTGGGGGGAGGGGVVDLAINKPASASTSESGNTPEKANDGSNSTRWTASSGAFPQWWEVDLGAASAISEIRLLFEGASKWKYRLEARATTSEGWTLLADFSANTVHSQSFTHAIGANGANKRHVRLTVTGYDGGYFWASLFNIQVMGTNGGTGGGGGIAPGDGLPGPGLGSGSVTREVWTGIPGTSVASIPLQTAPSFTGTLAALEAPSNSGDNYGQRLEGYLHPSNSGPHTFWIAGDDNVELWLSPGENPAGAVRIAWHNGWTNSREWNKYPTQKSAPVSLVSGQKYYLRVLMKEGGGGDNLAVSWRLNSTDPANGNGTFIVPGSALSPKTQSGASPQAVTLETYDPPAAKSGVTHRVFSDSPASGGSCAVLESAGAGHFVTYAIPNVNAGTYSVWVRYKRANNRAVFQTATSDALDGAYTDCGGTVDGFNPTMDFVEVRVGTAAFASGGTKFVRFTAVGRNPSSSNFWIAIDRVRLQP